VPYALTLPQHEARLAFLAVLYHLARPGSEIDRETLLRDERECRGAQLCAPTTEMRRHEGMSYDPTRHHRRSTRLPAYDYGQAGAYFVTICTQNRECAFGEVVDGEIVLNEPGRMVETVWRELSQHYPGVEVDALAVMPNHVHGIIMLVGAGPCACPDNPGRSRRVAGQPQGVAPTGATGAMSLPDVVHRFKSLTTARYRRGVLQDRWLPFPGRLWQRNYYEHVIRNEEELDRVRQYIVDNPERWEEDRENPNNVGEPNVGAHGRAPLRHPDGWTCPTP